jgi:tetratricopeptide (TPR) repeat protein
MKCIYPHDGALLTQYTLNLLNDEDQYRFEEHVMNCDFCRLELQKTDPRLMTAGFHREQLVETLHSEGISFDGLKRELKIAADRSGALRELIDHIVQWMSWLFFGKRWIPIAGTIAIVILLVLLPMVRQSGNPYLSMLTFEKVPYQEYHTRAGITPSPMSPLFSMGMQAYNEGNYKDAAAILSEATVESPANWSGWFFLGVSYFMDGQAKPAIDALLKADSLNRYAMEIEVKWYLAQAYLLNNDPDGALPYLQWLAEKPGEYSSKAKDLINKIHAIETK